MITDLIQLGRDIIKRVIPDKEKQKEAELKLLDLEQSGDLKEAEGAFNAIVAEAKSKDKYVSRSRPSFLYVMYIMILSSLPMGCLYAYNPTLAHNIATGMKEWLAAIPNSLWSLFGVGYVGYSVSRSYDKGKILNKK